MNTNTHTDTPETDAVIASDAGDSGFIRDLVIHARKLERERDAALRELAKLKEVMWPT